MLTFLKNKITGNSSEIIEDLDDDFSKESIKNYLYKSFIADDILDLCFISNQNANEIERKLSKGLKRLFKSDDFKNQGLRLNKNLDEADCVIFMLSDNLSLQDFENLNDLSDSVIKLGFVTSAVYKDFDFSDFKNLFIITQNNNALLPKTGLKKRLTFNNDTKFIRLPLSPFINIEKDKFVDNTLEIPFNTFEASIGLYELITASLPANHSGVEIICENNETASKYANTIIYNKQIFVLKNKVILKKPDNLSIEDKVLQEHATIKLLRIIRQTLSDK